MLRACSGVHARVQSSSKIVEHDMCKELHLLHIAQGLTLNAADTIQALGTRERERAGLNR
jgi:hypothetical protein